MKKWLMTTALLLTSSQTQGAPACEGINLTELKEKFLSEVHNEQDYKAFKPYKWKICARTLGTTLYKEEKDKADKIKEEQAETAKDNEDTNKEGEDKGNKKEEDEKEEKVEDESPNASKEDKDKPDENKEPITKEIENKSDENPDENKEGAEKDKEDDNKTDEIKESKKFSKVETDIANHYLHRVYPNYPLP